VRIRIVQDLSYSFEQPARALICAMRIMPRDHEGQLVASWRIEPSLDGRLRAQHDAFGNLVHHFQADGLIERFGLRIEGVVETSDTAGVIRQAPDPQNHAVFLRETTATTSDDAIKALARKAAKGQPDMLSRLHTLMRMIHETVAVTGNAAEPERAAEALAGKRAAPSGHSHLFAAAARLMGAPARVVQGIAAAKADEALAGGGRHSWAEAFVEGLGWVGFDTGQDMCPVEKHVRIAVGLDQHDCMPIRLGATGGGAQTQRFTMVMRRA
jgi:transglutaminase-like putative cysteine protease